MGRWGNGVSHPLSHYPSPVTPLLPTSLPPHFPISLRHPNYFQEARHDDR